MRKIAIISIVVFVFLFLTVSPALQQEQHEVVVTNVKIPLRVFEQGKFVTGLNMSDFEVFEDGVLQEVKALYLTRNGRIERMDALRDYMPMASRQFYFLFQIMEYNPKITDAIEYFFKQVYQPGDSVVLQTPLKNYNLPAEKARKLPIETLIKDMQTVIRRDAQVGAMEYKDLMRDLRKIVRSITSSGGGMPSAMQDLESSSSVGIQSLEFLLPRYRDTLLKLEQIRLIDEKWILRFASQLKRLDKQKIVYFFYEREFRPEIQPSMLNKITSNFHDDVNVMGQIQDLFQVYHRELTLDEERLSRAFADTSALLNFFFINRKPESVSGVHMREQSEDVFKVFSQVARATGGFVDNSQNPASAFRSTSQAMEYCYLLYYSPQGPAQEKGFRTIEVKVPGRDYRIVHRSGYFTR